ncbi:hypothetical protein BCR44DRAFT_317070 [Catenaria anguillulae PL171]|uniref:Uncharacterized protein n=1 Tax=Catenaria anguillulae PL171 TaxID=765915 RepID=A0A1Y2HBK7_9FUNG|nr:hypothetical protein BCR44DRAFT_317070 [Catenaria anguillulae PL171]
MPTSLTVKVSRKQLLWNPCTASKLVIALLLLPSEPSSSCFRQFYSRILAHFSLAVILVHWPCLPRTSHHLMFALNCSFSPNLSYQPPLPPKSCPHLLVHVSLLHHPHSTHFLVFLSRFMT